MTLIRRSIIRGAGPAGSLLAAGGLPLWARGAQPPGEPAPAQVVHAADQVAHAADQVAHAADRPTDFIQSRPATTRTATMTHLASWPGSHPAGILESAAVRGT